MCVCLCGVCVCVLGRWMGSRQEYHWESDEVLSACAGSVMSDFSTPRDCCPPSSAVHGIFQARIPEWLAIFLLQGIFPNQGSNPFLVYPLLAGGFFYHCTTWEPQSLKVVVKSLSHVQLIATPWTAAHQASLSFPTSRSLLKLMSIELLNLATLAPWKCTHPPCAHCCSQQWSGPWSQSWLRTCG